MAQNEPISEETIHSLEHLLQQNNLEQIGNMLKIIFKNEECVKNPFLFVCKKSILTIVKLFVKYKFGINQVDDNGANGFIYACKNGNFEIVKLLFKKNVELIKLIIMEEMVLFMLVKMEILKL